MNTQKYFLVEENKYNSLLKSYDPEHLNIAQNDLNNILNNPQLNISSKSALYNSALKNYIRKLKQADEKPIKVEDKNLISTNSNLEQTLQNLTNLLQNTNNRRPSKRISSFIESVPYKTSRLDIPTSTSFTMPLSPVVSDTPILDNDFDAPSTPETNNVANLANHNKTPRQAREKASNTKINERKTQELANYLLNNPQYGFTEEGKLVSPRSKKSCT